MSNLHVSVCPVCGSADSLFRQTTAVQDHEIVWYECRVCSSFLLWVGEDRWIFQKVGREDKAQLLKQTLSTAELEAMVQVSTAAKTPESTERDEPGWGARVNTRWRGEARDYPQWARGLDQRKWGEKGLLLWDHGAQTVTHLSAAQAVDLREFLRTEEAWKREGIVLGENSTKLKPNDPEWEPQTCLLNKIQLSPAQVRKLFEVLAREEAELRRMSEFEKAEKERRRGRVYSLLLDLAREESDAVSTGNEELQAE